jgi:hypothetical protein
MMIWPKATSLLIVSNKEINALGSIPSIVWSIGPLLGLLHDLIINPIGSESDGMRCDAIRYSHPICEWIHHMVLIHRSIDRIHGFLGAHGLIDSIHGFWVLINRSIGFMGFGVLIDRSDSWVSGYYRSIDRSDSWVSGYRSIGFMGFGVLIDRSIGFMGFGVVIIDRIHGFLGSDRSDSRISGYWSSIEFMGFRRSIEISWIHANLEFNLARLDHPPTRHSTPYCAHWAYSLEV